MKIKKMKKIIKIYLKRAQHRGAKVTGKAKF